MKNHREQYSNFKLINFNVPLPLLDAFDFLNSRQSTNRTSTLVSLMEGWVRNEEKRIQRNNDSGVYDEFGPQDFYHDDGRGFGYGA